MMIPSARSCGAGPRSTIRTLVDRPFARFVTRSQCAERIARVGSDHRVHVEPDAAGGFPAVEFLAVIRGQPFSGLENPRRAATWRCRRDPRGAPWKTPSQTHDHDPDGSSHATALPILSSKRRVRQGQHEALLFQRPCKCPTTKSLARHRGHGRRHGSCGQSPTGEVP